MHEMREMFPKEFPPLLREINDPPEKLFIKGSLPDPEIHTYLAVIGPRKFSSYGRECCERLIAGLKGFPVAIVSGLALGIDGIAHRAALAANLRTIAVPGSGLGKKVLYPSVHRQLAHDIVEAGGCLISEYEENFRATVWTFPARNRIVAGMSTATLVIEAAEKSGALITARLALDYNRDVLVVPGSIFSPTTRGAHRLMRHGAMPITSSEELLEELNLASKEKTLPLINLTPLEAQIMDILTEPTPRDVILEELGMPIGKANAALVAMEIKGLVVEIGGFLHVAR